VDIRCVGVIGSGTMGSGIATVAAMTGHEVIVRSRSEATAGRILASLDKHLNRQVEKGNIDEARGDAIRSNFRCTSSLEELADCDMVIESVIEDKQVKGDLFAELDRICRDDTILVSNTSTFAITELAMRTGRPERVCGMHFFNPATVMPLVEVASTLMTDEATITSAVQFAEACGKRPVRVPDVAGFIVNQILFGYLSSSLRLLGSTVTDVADIDVAVRGALNFPMGPFELMDLIGIDVCVPVFDALYEEYREPQFICPPILRRMASAGRLGRKTGRGFYDYP
jgi:3-hydroxybutyryl-CoA dehydrogenase